MSPLIALASILGIFALILIPLMMTKSGQPESHDPLPGHGNQRKKADKKKMKR